MHRTDIQLRFNDVDQMGHVNNAVIMEFFDLGKSEYFAAAGMPPEEGEFTVIVVHVEADFKQQIRARDKVHVLTQLDHFGTKSLTMMQQVVESTSGNICAVCKTIMSGYSRKDNCSATIPDTIKEKILRYEEQEINTDNA